MVTGHPVFAACYDALNASMERHFLGARRADLISGLTGEVLDIGAGTGANLPHFTNAGRVVALEPDPAMRKRLAARVDTARVPVEISTADAETLPFEDDSFDAVVCTLVLCTIPDPARALAEARRVLKPGGKLVVLEHVRGTGKLAVWQDRLAPVWTRFAAGCLPNRDTRSTIEGAGFVFDRIETLTPFPRWALIRNLIEGVAADPAK